MKSTRNCFPAAEAAARSTIKWLRPLVAAVVCLLWLGPACSEQPVDLNLLRNSSFQKQTNKGLPDYWDLHHAAAMTFRSLHDQYGVDENAVSPVPGAKVLRIVNSENDFPHLMLWPTRFDQPLLPGKYTFSVYMRTDRSGAICTMDKKGNIPSVSSHRLSREWKRYTTTFHTTESDRGIQPSLYFKSKAAYYVAAPQLEKGAEATPFQPDTGTERRESAIAQRSLVDAETFRRVFREWARDSRPLEAVFEYDYYTNDDVARLFIVSTRPRALILRTTCGDARGTSVEVPAAALGPESETHIDIPLQAFAEGEFFCTLKASDESTPIATLTAKSQKKSPSSLEVRVNQHRRSICINRQPFQPIGIAARGYAPEWYFEDLADHGFNTIFYTSPVTGPGVFDLPGVKNVLDSAARHRLRVIVGLPLMGRRPPDWQLRLAGFRQLVALFKNHPAVLGWWAYDEPYSWTESELLQVYRSVKEMDPYHLVVANWSDIPTVVGREPLGTLSSTDVYSLDYYPFASANRTLPRFGVAVSYVSRTARMKHKPSHVFIQLYGGENAWREPTGDELNFMTVFALMTGSATSYWEAKSNSKETWKRIAQINANARMLSNTLFLDPKAREVWRPRLEGGFVVSLWLKDGEYYAIVLNPEALPGQLAMDISSLVSNRESRISTYLGTGPERLAKGHIMDSFGPYEAKVYVFGSR